MNRAPQAEPVTSTLAVGAVVVDRASRILLVRRARPPGEGTWTLPGGRVEGGESLAAAVSREVGEETALRARVVCALDVVFIEREGFRSAIHEHLLVPLDDDAAPRAGDDASDARWVCRQDLDGFGVRADAIAVIDRGLAEARTRGLAPR
jgi:8-oxo-dGTP diphosphatase